MTAEMEYGMKFSDHHGKPLDLILYKYDACPFCIRVRRSLKKLGLQVPMRDIQSDAGARQELSSLGGSSMVPALSINGKIMYESRDIIEFLKTQVVALQEDTRSALA